MNLNLLWVEDEPDEIKNIQERILNEHPNWTISVTANRSQTVDRLVTGLAPALVVLDGRLQGEFTQPEDQTGKNLLHDFRHGHFGDALKQVAIVVYSKNVGAIQAFNNYDGPEPAPLILNKSEPEDKAYNALVDVMITVERALALGRPRTLVAHYGAGKIGFGALLPLVRDKRLDTGVVIINRSSSNSAFSGWAFDVRNAGFYAHVGAEKYTVYVWHEKDPSCNLSEAVLKCRDRGDILLAITSSPDDVRAILGSADLVTMSVGSKSIQSVAHELADALPARLREIHALENDHNTVQVVREKLAVQGVTLYPVVVDRICTTRNHRNGDLVVTVESLPAAMTLFKTQASQATLGEKSGVTLVDSSNEFEFFHLKKRWLMNFVHWSIAVTRAARLLSNGRVWTQIEAYRIDESAGNTAEQELFGSIARLSAALVASATSPALLENMGWASQARLYNDLLGYAERSIQRTDQVQDTFGRVLKQDGYFDKYKDFFDTFKNDFDQNTGARCRLARIEEHTQDGQRVIGHIHRLESCANDVRRALPTAPQLSSRRQSIKRAPKAKTAVPEKGSRQRRF